MTRDDILAAIDKQLQYGRPEYPDLHTWWDECVLVAMRCDCSWRRPLPSDAPEADREAQRQNYIAAIVAVAAMCHAALEAQP